MAKEEVKELPSELWEKIGKLMENQVDLQMFRSICKATRAHLVSPSLSLFPLSVPRPPHLSSASAKTYYIGEHTGYLIKSESETNANPPNLLVFESKIGGDGRVFFPFRLFPTTQFRSDERPQKLDLQKIPVSFVYKTYYLHCCISKIGLGETNIAQKLVLLSYFRNTNHPSSINPLFATSCDVELAAVALLPKGNLAHIALNNNTTPPVPVAVEWKLLADATRIDDIINYDGKLWGVDFDGGAFVMEDFSSLKLTQVAASPVIFIQGKPYIWDEKISSHPTPIASPFYKKGQISLNASNGNHISLDDSNYSYFDDDSRLKGRKRLVESSGMLYMLFPCRLDDNVIKVFQLTLRKAGPYPYEWVEVKSIGSSKAFFVGLGFGFSMTIRPELGLNGNCIYLSGSSFCRSALAKNDFPLFEDMSKPGPTTGVYSLMDEDFRSITPLDSPLIYCTTLPSSLRHPPPPSPSVIGLKLQNGFWSYDKNIQIPV